MNRYLIIFLSSLILEIASTFYITFVSEKNPLGMWIFAFIGPFLGLPFVGFMIESKTWREKIKVALASAIGYLIGSVLTYFFIK
jgi:Na+/melibiose symporter-like transporter